MPNVQEIMSTDLQTLPPEASVDEAARLMRDADIGDVIVLNDDGSIAGLVTDRDITIRAVANGLDPNGTALADVCSADLVTLTPTDEIGDALTLMREHAVRRIPVVEGNSPIGIVSIGDLAAQLDPKSVLGQISQHTGNT